MNFWFNADPEKLAKLKELQAELKAGLVELNKMSEDGVKTDEKKTKAQEEFNKKWEEFKGGKTNEQKIGETLFEQLKKENELLEAKIKGTDAVKKLEREIAETKMRAAKIDEDEIQRILDRNEDLKEQLTLQEKISAMWKSIGDDIKSGVVDGIKAAITGAKSFGEVMSNMLNKISDKLLNLAIDSIFSSFGGGGGGSNFLSKLFGQSSEGRYASSPMVSTLAEKGEPEYVIPAGRMAEASSRYNSGMRGDAVIPRGGGSSSGSSGSGGTTTVNYSGPILSFNSEEFVPKSAINSIIASASSRGAKAGESRTLNTLRNSRSTRSRLGM